MINILKTMKANTNSELTKEVIDIILDEAGESDEEIIAYLENVTIHGCATGTVSSLIYYSDTEAFFDRHVDEIFDLYNEAKAEYGEMDIELSRNNLAWFGFETMAQNILYELESANEF